MDIRHHTWLRHGDRLYASLSVAKYRGGGGGGRGRGESRKWRREREG